MIEEVFGEQFYKITVDDCTKNNLRETINKEFDKIKDSFGSWSHCKVDSTFFKDEWLTNYDSINYDGLIETIEKELRKILENQNANFDDIIVYPPWLNVYNKFDFQEPHDHIGTTSQFSCIYFLQYDSTCDAKLYFNNPNRQIHELIGMNKIFNNKNYQNNFYPEISEGQLLIFPSYMVHGVSVQHSDNKPRITIAANISIIY